jgi:DNA-binding GntR family transcriptional regulator
VRTPWAGTVGEVPELNDHDPTPLWAQLAGALRADIEAGTLSGRVPSARALAAAYSVSRETAVRALRALADEGLTVSVRGRGTFTVPRDD